MRGSNFQAHRRMLFASPSAAHTTRTSGCPDRQSWVRACLQLPHEPQLLWDRAPQTHLRVSALATPAARVQEAEPQRTIATGGGAFGRRNSLKPSGRPPLLRGLPQQPKPVPQLSRLTGPWRRPLRRPGPFPTQPTPRSRLPHQRQYWPQIQSTGVRIADLRNFLSPKAESSVFRRCHSGRGARARLPGEPPPRH